MKVINLLFVCILRVSRKMALKLLRKGKLFNFRYMSVADDIFKDTDLGYEILYGEYSLGSFNTRFEGFDKSTKELPAIVLANLYSFDWLADLRSINTIAAKARIHYLVNSWLDYVDESLDDISLNDVVMAKRIFNYLTSPVFAEINDSDFQAKLKQNLSTQVNFFFKTYRLTDVSFKEQFLYSKVLFVISTAISLPKARVIAINNIICLLQKLITSDGGMLDGSPSDVLDALENVVFVFRQLDHKREFKQRQVIRPFLDKMSVFIKTIRHLDRGLAVFNCGVEGNPKRVDFILSLCGVNAEPFKNKNLRHSGYFGISEQSGMNVMLKVLPTTYGPKQYKSLANHLLTMEASVGDSRVFVNNCMGFTGVEYNNEREYLSTLTFYDKNNNIVPLELKNDNICRVEQRVDQTWHSLIATYKGLQSKGLIWHRTLQVSKGSEACLLGEDLLTLSKHSDIKHAVLKLLLHPRVIVKEFDEKTNSITISFDNHSWSFRASQPMCSQEEVYTAMEGVVLPTHSINILLNKERYSVEWFLMPKHKLAIASGKPIQ